MSEYSYIIQGKRCCQSQGAFPSHWVRPLAVAEGPPHQEVLMCLHDHDDDTHDHSHSEHAHGEQSRAQVPLRPLGIALVITGVVLIAEVVGGLLTNSLALLADAGHMATDAAALALSLGSV